MKEMSDEQLGWYLGIPTFILYVTNFYPDAPSILASSFVYIGAVVYTIKIFSERKKWIERLFGISIVLLCVSLTFIADYLRFVSHYKH